MFARSVHGIKERLDHCNNYHGLRSRSMLKTSFVQNICKRVPNLHYNCACSLDHGSKKHVEYSIYVSTMELKSLGIRNICH
jgi:hypothetical protein